MSQMSSIHRFIRFIVMLTKKTNCCTHSRSKESKRWSIGWQKRIESKIGSNRQLLLRKKSMRFVYTDQRIFIVKVLGNLCLLFNFMLSQNMITRRKTLDHRQYQQMLHHSDQYPDTLVH